MKTLQGTPTIAIDTTRAKLRGLKLPGEWNVRRGRLANVLRQGTHPDVVVFPFSKRPTIIEIKSIAQTVSPLLEDPHEHSVVLLFPKREAWNLGELTRFLESFESPEKVEIAAGWEEVVRNIFEALAKAHAIRSRKPMTPARRSALDTFSKVVQATEDLRTDSGRLSAEPVSELFGISKSELARLVGRTPQSLSKTPDAESLQTPLEYFDKIARLRILLKGDTAFRKWLRTRNPSLDDKAPLELIREKKWQVLADFVDDILTGTPG